MVQDGVRANLTRPLTRRQHECVELVTEGLSSKEIARKLGIAPSTVDNHIAQVMHQLGIPNRAALRKYHLVGRTLAIVEDAPVVEAETDRDKEKIKGNPRKNSPSWQNIIRLRNSILIFSGISYVGLAFSIIFSTLITAYLINLRA